VAARGQFEGIFGKAIMPGRRYVGTAADPVVVDREPEKLVGGDLEADRASVAFESEAEPFEDRAGRCDGGVPKPVGAVEGVSLGDTAGAVCAGRHGHAGEAWHGAGGFGGGKMHDEINGMRRERSTQGVVTVGSRRWRESRMTSCTEGEAWPERRVITRRGSTALEFLKRTLIRVGVSSWT
jgi:hypothetical protein